MNAENWHWKKKSPVLIFIQLFQVHIFLLKKIGFLHPSSLQGSKVMVIKEMITAVGFNSAGEEEAKG